METRLAKIEWLSKEQGGYDKPPQGTNSYIPLVRFLGDPWPPGEVTWSLVVDKLEPLSNEWVWIAKVHFFAYAAPHYLLQPGRQFELYEGGKRVAHGEVLESDTESP